jgi:GH24 family phage-related lysozyme (muramidase)
MLCRKTDKDSAGNVCDLTLTQGGEAMAYMKQLLGMPDGRTTAGSALRQVERLLSWSKLASVGFSAFFQIATAFESQAAASGFTQAFLGNLPGRSGAKLGRAIGRALGRKGGLGAFQADAISFKDIVENINSNDPFMKEARELCDLVGMPLDQAVDPYAAENEANPGLTQGSIVKRDIEKLYRMMQRFGLKGAGTIKSFLNFAYQHPTDYTFNVVLNGVKLAVVAQTMRRLREECAKGSRPFDPVTELRRHAAYIDAEIGGIDPGRYAWATPQMQRILRLAMFSWQWTVGAWVAGSGEVISDAVFGGHSTTRASRQFALIRWMRMLGIVKFGVPLVLQMAVKLLARAMSKALPPPDDEVEEEETHDERMVPWMMWNNESKAGSLSFDITPLLKIARRVPGAVALKEADIPVISALVPAYVGGGRNTTGRRRYYMHFGKQSDEFFRYFDGPTGALNQMLSKGSTGLQAASQLLFGHSLSGMPGDTDITKPQVILNMFLPFSWQGAKANADTGILAALGPVRMGQSKRSTRLRIVERLNQFVEDERTNDPWSYGKNRRRLNLLCTDILREAQLNGVDPASIMTSALGDVAHIQYLKLMDSLPKDANSNDVDTLEAMKAVRALVRVNRKTSDIKSSIVQKYEAAGIDVKRNPRYRAALWDLVRTMRQAPFRTDADMKARFDSWFDTALDVRYRRATQLDAKGGENFGNFLATDEVPDTLFGVPVVKDGYTDEDLAFFAEHPEAGGYYDLGEDAEPPEPPDEPPPDGGRRAAEMAGETAAPAWSDTDDAYAARIEAAMMDAIPFIKEHEGFREKAYQDSVGVWTIGYGQTEINGRPVKKGDTISEKDASAFVESRARSNAALLHKQNPWMRNLSPGAMSALFDVAYNLGVGALDTKRSPTLNSEMSGADMDFDAILWRELPSYASAGGKRLKGLVNRRNDAIKKWRTM